MVSENSELKRAVSSKETKSNDAGSVHRDAPEREEVKLPAETAKAYRDSGYKWDGVRKLYTRPTKDGKNTLFIEPNSGKTGILD